MVLKRNFSDQGDGGKSELPSHESKRRLTFAILVKDVMKGLTVHEILTKLEPFMRRVVQEEVERAIIRHCHSSPRPSLDQSESGERAWRLHFDDKFPSILFTSTRIESEDSKPIKIVLWDVITKKIVTSGPLSSIKVEIVVLDGDFGPDDQEDWTDKEFSAKIVREREGKRPLVTGELVVLLREGVGYVGDISFTDNSSWIRSRRFRLGARSVQNVSTEARIIEAISEAFIVKDHRGESHKKHYPPMLGDETWRLERIAKDGAFHNRLVCEGINTVKDFLRLYYIDQSSLRNILGGGISSKTWETIVEHATSCVLNDKLYIYYREPESIGLVFNSVYKVVGATFDGQNYLSLEKLSALQMGLVENLKSHAYNNVSDFVPLHEPPVFGSPLLPSSQQADPFSNPRLDPQRVNFSVAGQGHLEMQLASEQIATLPPFSNYVEDNDQLEVPISQHYAPLQELSPSLRDDFLGTYSCTGIYGGNNWVSNEVLGPVMQLGHLTAYDNSLIETSPWQGNGLILASNSEAVGIVSSNFGIHVTQAGKPKARWCMIRAAVKIIAVRRVVAAKRMAKPFYMNF